MVTSISVRNHDLTNFEHFIFCIFAIVGFFYGLGGVQWAVIVTYEQDFCVYRFLAVFAPPQTRELSHAEVTNLMVRTC